MDSDTGFLSHAIISVVLLISLILFAKSLIWFMKKLFGFVDRTVKLVLFMSSAMKAAKPVIMETRRGEGGPARWAERKERLCRHGRRVHQKSKEPCKQKENNMIMEHGCKRSSCPVYREEKTKDEFKEAQAS